MASASGIRAGKAYVELHGKEDGLQATLKRSEGSLRGWGSRVGSIGRSAGSAFSSGLKLIGAASIASAGISAAKSFVTAFGKAFLASSSELARLSQLPKTGISAEDVRAAKVLEVAMSTLSTSVSAAWAQISAATAPVLTEILNGISAIVQGITKWLSDWRKNNAETVGGILKDFKTAWGGIVAAVSSGDLATAGEIAWITLKLKFLEAVQAMGVSWTGFQKMYLDTISLIGDAWDLLWTRVVQGFDIAMNKLRNGWTGTQTFLAKGIAVLMGLLEGKTAEERQQVVDEIDAEQRRNVEQRNADLAARNTEREDALQQRITERAKALADAVAALPTDDARLNDLRARLESLAQEARANAPGGGRPQLYQPTVATAGTFNAAAIRGIAGGGGPLDKIAKSTEETAKHTKKLANKPAGGPVFAGGGGVGF